MKKKLTILRKGKKLLLENRLMDGFIHLLFPSSCVVCNGELARSEQICCSICYSELSYTYFENSNEPTSLDHLFWGRVDISATYALLYYEKTNNVKPILQALKYKGRSDVGIQFGELLGNKLQTNKGFRTVEALIPVPIHYKKKYIRGYNQSELLAKGISKSLGVPMDKKIVSKTKHTKSQTTLGRFKRWDNVEGLFYVDETIRNYRHIAIVDDVITTGATLESIMQQIRLVAPTIKISIISLAVVK